MKLFILILSVFMMSATYAEMTKKECKEKGYKFDKKKKDCDYEKPLLKGKEKKAYKIVEAAAKRSRHGKKLTVPEKIELAKDLVSYSKRSKVKLNKVKVTFDTTGVSQNTTAEELKEISSRQGIKLYHVDEGSTTETGRTQLPDEIITETMTKEIDIPTSFFPPNEYEYTQEGREGLLHTIVNSVEDDWHIFNVTIVESSASKLANTNGKYRFNRSDSLSVKREKLLGLAKERGEETAKILKQELEGILVENKNNAIISGPADVFETGDTSGEQPPASIVSASKNVSNSSNRKEITEFYNQFQYVKVEVQYMRETKDIIPKFEEFSKEIPNAEGIVAQFKKSKKIKTKKYRKPRKKLKIRLFKKKYKNKKRRKKNWGSIKCPTF